MIDLIDTLLLRSGIKGGKKVKANQQIFHGTDPLTIKKIREEGFQPSKFGWLGQGVYTTPDQGTAATFGQPMKGRLPPGMRIKDYPADVATKFIFGEKPQFSLGKNANIAMDAYDLDNKAYADYDNDLSKNPKFKNTDAIRWRIKGEDQILFLDPKVANTAFYSDGPKAAPKSMRSDISSPRKFLTPQKILKSLQIGSGLSPSKSGLGRLINAMSLGIGGAKLVEKGLEDFNTERRRYNQQRIPNEFNKP